MTTAQTEMQCYMAYDMQTKALTLRGNRIGNQLNIPGECVEGRIPATYYNTFRGRFSC